MSDLINRQDAINAVSMAIWHYPNFNLLNDYDRVYELVNYAISQVASKEPEREKGKWIVESDRGEHIFHIRCSNCHNIAMWCNGVSYVYPKFCPTCGAKMEGGKNDKR